MSKFPNNREFFLYAPCKSPMIKNTSLMLVVRAVQNFVITNMLICVRFIVHLLNPIVKIHKLIGQYFD